MDKKNKIPKVGMVLRTFAREKEQLPGRVKLMKETLNAVLKLTLEDWGSFIQRIDIVVPENDEYRNVDFGWTVEGMKELVWDYKWKLNVVVTSSQEDLFVGLLNETVKKQQEAGMDYSLIISPDASSYLTSENFQKMLNAVTKSEAKVAWLAIKELYQSVMEWRIANTAALWHINSLLKVGWFDKMAAMAKKSDDSLEQKIDGVEEIIPLLKMFLKDDKKAFIAPIVPELVGKYKVPDMETDPGGYIRHLLKMESKLLRQKGFVDMLNAVNQALNTNQSQLSLADLKKAVLPKYKVEE